MPSMKHVFFGLLSKRLEIVDSYKGDHHIQEKLPPHSSLSGRMRARIKFTLVYCSSSYQNQNFMGLVPIHS